MKNFGTVYWIVPLNAQENTSYANQIYYDLRKEKPNVVRLSGNRNRDVYRYDYDLLEDEDSRRASADRDASLCRFFSEQGFDVVYSSREEFEEVSRWVEENIQDCHRLDGEAEVDQPVDAAEITPGTLYWFTGLSGAGKTTIGKLLYGKLRKEKDNVVLMDGDMLRSALKRYDYSRAYREKRSYRDVEICKMITDQGIDIVWCGINMFEGVREWSRAHIPNYREIYLEVPMEVLFQRDTKGLYAGAREGRIKDVVGMDQKAELPKSPDVHYVNDGSVPPEQVLGIIWQQLEEIRAAQEKKHSC